MRKSQAWSMDFAASVVIFVTALILIIFALNYTIYQNQQQINFNMMENTAMTVSDSLVRQPGIPRDWNSTNVTTIGLASQENVLNETKLSEFLNMNDNTIKSLLGIANYEFYFEVRYPNGTLASLPGGAQITKGGYPSDARIIIPVERHALYMEKPARMVLILWD
ncbi:MAG: hypothetical protein NTY20_04710 [Candidatus Aenigmarchaeota archaeon]|nr:hypothetical protein [Candidatus Aenigmarchaeota archaeon]